MDPLLIQRIQTFPRMNTMDTFYLAERLSIFISYDKHHKFCSA